jgi:hypothetical protein
MFTLPFMNPVHQMERMRARAASAMRSAVPYAEFKLPRGCYDCGIVAETFKPENPLANIFPDVEPVKGTATDGMLLSPDGSLAYCLRVLPKGSGLPIASSNSLWIDDARVFFTEDIVVPTLLFLKTNGVRGWTPWMSLTPFELLTQRSGVRAATKHVVLAGLGMGWLLRQIAAKRTVKSITVIEKDQQLIDWFGQRVCDETPKTTLVCADFWEVARDYDKEHRFIVDVWPGHGEAAWDHRLEALREDGYRCWAWGSPRGSKR